MTSHALLSMFLFLFSFIATSFSLGHNIQTFKLITLFFHVDERLIRTVDRAIFASTSTTRPFVAIGEQYRQSSSMVHIPEHRWSFISKTTANIDRPIPYLSTFVLNNVSDAVNLAIAKRGKERHNIRQHLDLAFFLLDFTRYRINIFALFYHGLEYILLPYAILRLFCGFAGLTSSDYELV